MEISQMRRAALALAPLIWGSALVLALIGSPERAARAQGTTVALMTVAEERIPPDTLQQLRSTFSDERSRLQIRLRAHQPDQTAGTMTTSVEELTARMIDGAMTHAAVVEPGGAPVVIGLVGQTDPQGARQLVLLNLTAWVEHGRRLGQDTNEAFAVLSDNQMQGPGDSFKVGGVAYLAKWENGSLAFHRVP
jgi:hypothetical protein